MLIYRLHCTTNRGFPPPGNADGPCRKALAEGDGRLPAGRDARDHGSREKRETFCIASNGDVAFSDNMDHNAWYRIHRENKTKQKME
jgi:hypothetical protein